MAGDALISYNLERSISAIETKIKSTFVLLDLVCDRHAIIISYAFAWGLDELKPIYYQINLYKFV